MLLNRAGQVFVARRIDMPMLPAWQMPQGGIDPGETPRQAALRELKEEIGTDKAEILGESRMWLKYDLPVELAGGVWGGRYRGQRQKWFAMRFMGSDADIDLATDASGIRCLEVDTARATAGDDRAVQAPALYRHSGRVPGVLRRCESALSATSEA